jgi:hypothetical protein
MCSGVRILETLGALLISCRNNTGDKVMGLYRGQRTGGMGGAPVSLLRADGALTTRLSLH